MSKPLAGVKVVELATFVAGPVSARLLADLGAEVIKVERPEGDAWRATGVSYLPNRFSKDENPVFDIYNAGKKHVALNLKTPEGMEAFHRLLADADVFITNTRPRALKRLGLSYEDIKEKYPSLVYGILLGYGEEGPE
jgi:crotonobetainyl-CoA:carnitine CoA-transferase CaiB-like acyl-CoA transferase